MKPRCSDGGSISKVGRPKTNDQIFFTTRAGNGVARNCKRGGYIISTFFPGSFFFNRTNLKLIKKQEKLSRGSGTCSPGKILKIYMV